MLTDVKLQNSVGIQRLSSGNLAIKKRDIRNGIPSGFQEDKNADYFRIQVVL